MTGNAQVPGISAAEDRCMQQGAREFFQTQGTDVLAEFGHRDAWYGAVVQMAGAKD